MSPLFTRGCDTVECVSEPRPMELTRVPVRLGAGWRSKLVTTDPPRYTPHDDWSLELQLTSEVPLRTASVLRCGAQLAWARRRSVATSCREVLPERLAHLGPG